MAFGANVAGFTLGARHRGIQLEVLHIYVGEGLFLGRVFHDDEVPALAVAARRGLQGNLQAFFHHRSLDGLVEIQALAHTAGGLQQVVG